MMIADNTSVAQHMHKALKASHMHADKKSMNTNGKQEVYRVPIKETSFSSKENHHPKRKKAHDGTNLQAIASIMRTSYLSYNGTQGDP